VVGCDPIIHIICWIPATVKLPAQKDDPTGACCGCAHPPIVNERRDTAVLGVLSPPKRAVTDIFTALDVSVQALGKKYWMTSKKLAF